MGYLLIYSKGKSDNFYMKAAAAALLLFPKKKTTKLFYVTEKYLTGFAAALMNFFGVPFTLSCCQCHVVIVMSFYASAPDGCCHKSPIPTHPLRIHKGTKAVGSGPLACKCYCPNVFLSLCVYHNI